MGRQTKVQSTDLAYIAGFLDGDGSVMVQVKNRWGTPKGWRLMFTICFYQDARHEKPLFWIQKKLGIGYISRRNDGITELRINGYEQSRKILAMLYPYVRFKRKSIGYILKILKILQDNQLLSLSKTKKKIIAKMIIKARAENYQSGLKKMEKLKTDLDKIIKW